MRNVIAILEDDIRRIDAMRPLLADYAAGYQTAFFDMAHEMIAWLDDNLDRTRLISLDHDLGAVRSVNGRDVFPGDGRDVARFLAGQIPCCPVIIHTSNPFGGDSMELTLLETGWQIERVRPYYDLEWIPNEWLSGVKKLLHTQSAL